MYAQRDDSARFDGAYAAAVREHPDDYGVLWRAARYQYWLADGASDDGLKKQRGKAAWDLGERAAKIRPLGVEGHYFSAIGLGAYAQAIGIFNALTQGLEGKFNGHVLASLKADEGFNVGGPHLAKGRALYEMPWPKRDLTGCISEMRRALALHPENLRAQLFLAECQLRDGQAKAAKDTTDQLLAQSVAYDPAEGRRVQQRARELMPKIAKELR